MEDDSQKGATKVCSSCKHIILSGAIFFGIGFFRIQCPNPECPTFTTKKKQGVTIGQKFFLTVTTLVILSFILLNAYYRAQAAKNVNCSLFKTRAEAQAFFDTNRIQYAALDKNNNGIPCEYLK